MCVCVCERVSSSVPQPSPFEVLLAFFGPSATLRAAPAICRHFSLITRISFTASIDSYTIKN